MPDKAFCLSCFKTFLPAPVRLLLEPEPLLCPECLAQIRSSLSWKKVGPVRVLFLGPYEGMMKDWLYRYKEQKDVALAPCFLSSFLPYLRLRFARSLFLSLPSSEARNQERGFVHLEEILRSSSLPFLRAFEKEGKEEQKSLGASERRQKKGICLLPEAGKEIEGKSVVLFDDVRTSGSTFLESYSALLPAHPAKVQGLILMDHQDGP